MLSKVLQLFIKYFLQKVQTFFWLIALWVWNYSTKQQVDLKMVVFSTGKLNLLYKICWIKLYTILYNRIMWFSYYTFFF